MHQQGGTIKEAVEGIASNEYVLPAIQREFIWQPEQVCTLFDSVMQSYPFGEFLIWRIKPDNVNQFKYYGFVLNHHQRDNPHCPELGNLPERPVTAVLDGQQRLTAFNIGLRGSMAVKLPRKWWNNPDAFPRRVLALDLLSPPNPDEEGNRYNFDFIDESRIGLRENSFWFRVSDILIMKSGPDMLDWIVENGTPHAQQSLAYRTLDRLYQCICVEKPIAIYEEKSQDIERVLNIFIRCNSGGTPLSYSDLLLSIAVSQWVKLDARREVHQLVDEMNRIGSGFSFTKNFVLKAGLMLSDIASVGFKVENFTQDNMAVLEENWERIRNALIATVQLAANFGFNGNTIRAESALLPIAYYIHRKESPSGFVTRGEHKVDRETIRRWLTRSFLKRSGIWGSGLDTLLTALRDVIRKGEIDQFPVVPIRRAMAQRGKTLEFSDEEVEELSDTEYGDRQIFALMALLFPVDLRNNFHIDHIFPRSRFSNARLLNAGVSDDQFENFRNCANRLGNLQLLDGDINTEKQATLPAKWLDECFSDSHERHAHCERHYLGDVPERIIDFEEFYRARRKRLRALIAGRVNIT